MCWIYVHYEIWGLLKRAFLAIKYHHVLALHYTRDKAVLYMCFTLDYSVWCVSYLYYRIHKRAFDSHLRSAHKLGFSYLNCSRYFCGDYWIHTSGLIFIYIKRCLYHKNSKFCNRHCLLVIKNEIIINAGDTVSIFGMVFYNLKYRCTISPQNIHMVRICCILSWLCNIRFYP